MVRIWDVFAIPTGKRGGGRFGDRRAAGALFSLLAIGLLVIGIGMAGCSRSDKGAKLSKRVIPLGQPVPKGGGRYKLGDPYQIAGRWYRPREERDYDRQGIASWYGELFHGRYTANGEIYDMDRLTAAHPTLPMPSYAQVTNLRNGRSIVVRVNDRGPYAHNRIIDLSRRSAQVLGLYRDGTAPVRVRYLGEAPLNGDDSYERRILASQPWARLALAKAPKMYNREVAETLREDDPINLPERKPAAIVLASADTPAPPRPPRDEAPARLAAPTVTARVPPPGPIGPGGRLIFVQAGAFRQKENANVVRRQLHALGPVYVYPAEISGEMWYRVRLGPFRQDALADEALRKAVAAGVTGARIVRN